MIAAVTAASGAIEKAIQKSDLGLSPRSLFCMAFSIALQ